MPGGGSKPGERRGGRKKNTPNRANASLRELARQYTEVALAALVQVVEETDSDAARVSAATAILDRGYGKPSTVLAGDEDGGAIRVATEIRLVGVRPE